MKSSRLRLIPLVLLAGAQVLSACDSDTAAPLDEQLRNDTGTNWTVHRGASGEVRFLAPQAPTKIGTGDVEAQARAFFTRYREALHAGSASELELMREPTTDGDGQVEVRFRHVVPGASIPVVQAVSLALFDRDGNLLYAQPGFREEFSTTDTVPAIAGDAAEDRAVAYATAECHTQAGVLRTTHSGLALRDDEAKQPQLIWTIRLSGHSDECTNPEVWVDANTGAIVDLLGAGSNITDRAGGVRFHALGEARDMKSFGVQQNDWYEMISNGPTPVETRLYATNKVLTTGALGSWDVTSPARGAAVDAHANTEIALQFFQTQFKRKGTDDRGSRIMVIVHDPFDDGQNASNLRRFLVADQMRCGDGNYLRGGQMLPLCSALDTVAHELAHGVTSYTSGLAYKGEAGALDEAFADVMGEAAERWFEGPDDERNFLVAERAFKGGAQPFLRDMRAPHLTGSQDHYNNLQSCAPNEAPNHDRNDDCYVHTNSGIPNLAFALMTRGGEHPTSRIGVPKLGWEHTPKIWFESITHLRPNATLAEAAFAQIVQASRVSPQAVQSVSCAWYAVGVLNPRNFLALDASFCAAPKAAAGPKPSSCDGRNSGVVCNSQFPSTALQCKDGKLVHARMCSSPGAVCKHPSDTDWTGTLDSAGGLVCEDR